MRAGGYFKTFALAAAAMVLGTGLGAASERVFQVASIAGVYKRSFPNEFADGEKYVSEDVLEIVGMPSGRAYFRARVAGPNGHLCAIHGIAKVETNTLVYSRSSDYPHHVACQLVIQQTGDRITLSDHGTCRDSCGARASLENGWFKLKARRPIRYMSRLKASKEFGEAIAETRR